MNQSERSALEDVVVGGLDDWADLGWVAQSVRESRPVGTAAAAVEPGELRDATVTLIEELLDRGLMVAGDVVDGTHVPWAASTAEAVDRIATEWRREWGTGMPTPGAIAWLANTAAGNELARAVLAKESE